MSNLIERVTVWVAEERKLHVYELVTEGEDANMAYDVRVIPMDEQPSAEDHPGMEVLRDHVELDYNVRARLGLVQITPTLVMGNAVWKGFGFVAKAVAAAVGEIGINLPQASGGMIRKETFSREYRVGHPKHQS